ncbi:MAG: GNAT family N-acetyltransferase [Chloroflexi bacterium]|nr:GNAT family N-acetyltransferase [Chloroflexota bacterium]
MITYFNYTKRVAEGWWGRHDFIRHWWRMQAADSRWTAPHYAALHRALDPGRNAYLAQRSAMLLYLEALPRRVNATNTISGTGFAGALMEEPVAIGLTLVDKRRRDGAAYLSLLHCANNPEVIEQFVGTVMEKVSELGCQRVIGPVGISPHLQSGVLQNFFHIAPPLHTPYNPPYLPELLEGGLEPFARSRLYFMETPVELPAAKRSTAELVPLEPARLSGDLRPLLATACSANGDFPPPDADEAEFLLRWLQIWPLTGWLAQVNDTPVGFVLLQPDLTNSIRRARGGRHLLWRLWLAWRSKRPVQAGRLLFGGVLPAWRGQGIGGQLWRQALQTAQDQQWQALTIGPIAERTPGAAFLEKVGAQARQQYVIYQSDL